MLCKTLVDSPFGTWEIRGSEQGIQSLTWKGDEQTEAIRQKPPEELEEASSQLKEYFSGKRRAFDLELDFGQAPEFYRAVWEELCRVPYGQTTTYLAIAQKLGDRNAVRAVGQANGANPIAVIVPCHRCIASNGDLQGYFYGLDFKRKLLALENPTSFAEQGALF